MNSIDKLYLNFPDNICHNYGISILSKNQEIIKKVKEIIIPKCIELSISEKEISTLNSFLKKEDCKLLYLNLLESPDEWLILEEALTIAKILEMELFLGYKPNILITDKIISDLKEENPKKPLSLLYSNTIAKL